MDLFEHEAKREFSAHGIPIPQSILVSNPSEIGPSIWQIKRPYVVKAQVLVGGRGKAGGILTAETPQEAQEAAAKLIGSLLKGLPVKQVLIEEKIPVKRELYLSIAIDRSIRTYVLLTSAVGGMEIEEIAEKTPTSIIKIPIDPQSCFSFVQAENIAKQIGYSGNKLSELSDVIQKLYHMLLENDAELVEINPLAETENGFVALDARMVIDDNALYRHPKYAAREAKTLTPQEELALKNNLAYVKLEGTVGIIGNGAGLVMATLDMLNLFGGTPADFLDLGGGASVEAITAALQIIFSNPEVKVVLVNVLGGITHCDDVARGIVKVQNEALEKKPIVVRLVGTNQVEGKKILLEAGISSLDSMEEAAKEAVDISKGGKN